MFRLSYTSKSEINGTLKLKRNPFYYGLGIYEDANGIMWDIAGVIGAGETPYVQARRITDAPSYYGTSSSDSCGGSHCWNPYLVELVKDQY